LAENGDYKFMRRCLDLAVRAEGMTYPNPMVGAVVVYNGIIIGEGYHLSAGTPHAEVNAINSVAEKSLLRKSTLYVSLEPCSHFGKTPPCTDLIISHKIQKVVIGTIDTSKEVSGRGLRKLVKSGCEVVKGVLEEECRWINKRFFTFHEKQRPYITLKWAQSADGFIDVKRPAGSSVEPYWITGKPERVLVHKWRAAEQSILVGAGTVRNDNPGLNVRNWKGKNPVKIILSRSGQLNKYLPGNETNGTVIVFTENTESDLGKAERIILNKKIPSALQIIDYLYKSDIQSMFIEGGGEVLNHFITMGLWDEAKIFSGNSGFNEGLQAPVIKGKQLSLVDFGTSRLKVLLNEAN
jgi:diaminohydroxyphosphoribosylaminopyrimidine deaminase / 5-amino-6-(5-phosphoribosylamino)uracil reductase